MSITIQVASHNVLRQIKEQKDLTAMQSIADKYSSQIHSYFNHEPASLKERVKLYKEMRSTAKEVADKINRSRSLIEWFLSCFGVGVGKGEKELIQAQKNLTLLINKTQHEQANNWLPDNLKIPEKPRDWVVSLYYALFGSDLFDEYSKPQLEAHHSIALKSLQTTAQKDLESVNTQMKLAAFSLAGSNELRGKSVEGINPYIAICAIRSKLEAFYEKLKSIPSDENIQMEIRKVEEIIRKISYAAKISEKMEFVQRLGRKECHFSDLAFEISEDVRKLSVGDSLLLPGAYLNIEGGGHAVLFEIKHDVPGKYSFRVVNTGDGILELDQVFGILKAAITDEVQDYITSGHDLNKIANRNFLTKILKNTCIPQADASAKKMLQPIIDHLLNGEIKKMEKSEPHFIQTNGSCSYDCLVAWIEGQLGKMMADFFELFILKTDLETVNKLPSQKIATITAAIPGFFSADLLKGEALVKKMSEWGAETLKKISNKLNKFLQDNQSRLDRDINELSQKILKQEAERQKLGVKEDLERTLQTQVSALEELKRQSKPLEDQLAERKKKAMFAITVSPTDEHVRNRDAIRTTEIFLTNMTNKLEKIRSLDSEIAKLKSDLEKAKGALSRTHDFKHILSGL